VLQVVVVELLAGGVELGLRQQGIPPLAHRCRLHVTRYLRIFLRFLCLLLGVLALPLLPRGTLEVPDQPTLARHKRVERAGVLVGRGIPLQLRLGRVQHIIHLLADLPTPRGLGFLVLLLVMQDHVVGPSIAVDSCR